MKHLTFLSFGFIFLIGFLTTIPLTSYCGGNETITPLTKINKEFLVVVHIITDKDSVPNISENDIKTKIAEVNTYFKPIEAKFTICEFRYVYNFNYDEITDSLQKYLFIQNRVDNRINLFFATVDKQDPSVCGNATLGGIANINYGGILIMKGDCFSASVIAHEMGHYFSLEHTFEQGHGKELVDGSNCATAGDGVCDTPADPYIEKKDLKEYLTNDCIFTSDLKDANSAYYVTDVSNIMSYYYPKCICNKFTHGQYEKMAKYYLANPVMW